jgi:hypothetical protein
MKRTVIFLSVVLMAMAFQDLNAQSIRSLMRKKIIEDNLEAQAKRDSARAVEEGREPDQSPNTTMTHVYMDALGLSEKVPYESSYDFDSYVQMEVRDFNKNGKETDYILYDSYVTKDAVNYAMVYKEKKDQTTIIFDSDNSAVLILTDSDGEKMGIASEVDPESLEEEMEEAREEARDEAREENSYFATEPVKTGKSKEILGYTCDEYLIDNEEIEAHMWVCEDLGRQIRKEMLDQRHTFGTVFLHAAYARGMVMEYEQMLKENGERTVMQVTDIDLNRSHTISTREYPVMGIKQKKEDPEGDSEE